MTTRNTAALDRPSLPRAGEGTESQLQQAYIQAGIAMGLSTGSDFDVDLVRGLLEKHRKANGIGPIDDRYFLIYDSPFAAIKAHKSLSAGNAMFGSFDAHQLLAWKYVEQVLGNTTKSAQTENLFELGYHVGWFWMSSNAAIVTRKPDHIRTTTVQRNGEEQIILHSYDHKAIEYRDGTGVYAINGINVPLELEWIVTTPAEQLNHADVLNIKNTELRTEAIKKIGIEAMFESLGKRTLDKASINPGGDYELFRVDIGAVERTYLRGACPSSGSKFFEAIHPEVTTVQQAIMWRETGELNLPFYPPATRT